MSKKYTLQDFKNKANKVHNFKYDYSKTEYTNNSTIIKYNCPEHGEIEQIARAHLFGKGCWKCAKPVHNTSSFIIEANKVHNFKYDYRKTEFVSSRQKCIITCHEHGDFLITPNHHISSNRGCPKCSQPYVCDDTKDFIDRSNKVHNFKYDYSKSVYTKPTDRVIIGCPFHGNFEQVIHSHLRGSGCHLCAKSLNSWDMVSHYKHNKELGKEIGSIYCVRFVNKISNETFYKVGITKQGIKLRYCGREYKNWDIRIIHDIKMSNIETALLENIIHKNYIEYKYIPIERFAGWTECYSIQIDPTNVTIGFIEMAQFYQKASKKEIAEMETIIKAEDWDAFKKLIYKKLNVKLK